MAAYIINFIKELFLFLFNGDTYILPKPNICIWAIQKSLATWKILRKLEDARTYYKEVSISIIL